MSYFTSRLQEVARAYEELTSINELITGLRTDLYRIGEDLSGATQKNPEFAWDIVEGVDPNLFQQLREMAIAGRRIDMVKALRNRYGMGLGEAKYMMDALYDNRFRLS